MTVGIKLEKDEGADSSFLTRVRTVTSISELNWNSSKLRVP